MLEKEISVIAKSLLLGLLRVYRRLFSPFLGRNCRFVPSCSAYAEEAFAKKNMLRASRLVASRLLRCHPFHPGGYDPVES